MNVNFPRRRGIRAFAEAIRPELHSLPVPNPRRELLDRILASRESGARVILPSVPADPRPRIGFIAAVVTIAAVLLLVVVPRDRSGDVSGGDTWTSSMLFGDAAFGATTSDAPLLPRVRLERANKLHPISVAYARRLRDNKGNLTRELPIELSLTAAELDGEPAWKVTALDQDISASQLRSKAETLYIARSNLRVLARSIHVSPYSRYERINVQQRFIGDSISGRMTTDGPGIGAGRVIARRLDAAFAPYLPDAFAPLFLMSVPLHRNWQGSASMLGWGVVPKDVFVPVSMRVEGDDRIHVPAGTFDCWRIGIGVGARHISFWARKSDGLGVRVYDQSDAAGKGTREIVLVSAR